MEKNRYKYANFELETKLDASHILQTKIHNDKTLNTIHLKCSEIAENSNELDIVWSEKFGSFDILCGSKTYHINFADTVNFSFDSNNMYLSISRWAKADNDTIEHLLLDQALPRFITHLGFPVTHAAGIRLGSQAIALFGDTGAGKSTLSASFLIAGYDVLSDDAILFSFVDNRVQATPTYSSIRLWPDAIGKLFQNTPQSRNMAQYSSKQRIDLADIAPKCHSEGTPLLCAFELVRTDRINEIVLEPMTAQQAFSLVNKSFFRLDPSNRQSSIQLFEFAADIARFIPYYRLIYPSDLSRLSEVRTAIIELVGNLNSARTQCAGPAA